MKRGQHEVVKIGRTEVVTSVKIGRTVVVMSVNIGRTEVVKVVNVEKIAQNVVMNTTIMITALQKINDAIIAIVKAILQWFAAKTGTRITVE